jgi:intracellular sulfur oxidation DsrE/DsrF family protein
MAKTEGKVPELIQSDAIATVPSGVVQIMVRQDQGWNYIRP